MVKREQPPIPDKRDHLEKKKKTCEDIHEEKYCIYCKPNSYCNHIYKKSREYKNYGERSGICGSSLWFFTSANPSIGHVEILSGLWPFGFSQLNTVLIQTCAKREKRERGGGLFDLLRCERTAALSIWATSLSTFGGLPQKIRLLRRRTFFDFSVTPTRALQKCNALGRLITHHTYKLPTIVL